MKKREPSEPKNRKKLLSLIHLWPAALTVILVLATLPMTQPVLAALPERLTVEESAAQDKTEQKPSEDAEAEALVAVVDANYEDGVHTGSAQGYGGQITVQVTVADGQITAIDILNASGETTSFFNRAMGVVDAVLTRQTWEVDVISGATYSSRGILNAIQNALTGEQVEQEEPVKTTAVAKLSSDSFQKPTGGYRDGTYTGSATGFGGQIRVKVTISDGKISAVKVVSAPKETKSYLNKAKAVTKRIVTANSPNVDTVSGATYTSNGIINAVKRALSQAANTGTGDVPVEEKPKEEENNDVPPAEPTIAYQDGVYIGTGEGFQGGEITVQVTIEGGRIIQVTLLSAEDETPSFLERASVLLSKITTTQSTELDVISGATYTSNGILDATRAALAQAILEEDDGETPPAEEPPDEETPDQETPDEETPDEPEEPEDTQPEPTYRDGVYTATTSCCDNELFAYEVKVTVTVTEGKITQIAVDKTQDTSEEPEANERYLDYAINGRTRKGTQYKGVVDQILSKQDAEAIDVVSGATYSSDAITKAVQKALQEAKGEAES